MHAFGAQINAAKHALLLACVSLFVLVDCRCYSCSCHNFNMSASINRLNEFGREDRFLVPVVPPGQPYVWDSEYIVLVKDKAQAATNAIAEVFPEADLHEAMCIIHASIRWLSVNSGKFGDHRYKRLCIIDINNGLKNLAHINFVEAAHRLMMQKWVISYQEPIVARDWSAAWGRDKLTRVENCQELFSPLRGAIPTDNNALEAGNNADKHAVVHKKTSLFKFVENVARTIVAPASMQDTLFEGRLKSRSNTISIMILAIQFTRKTGASRAGFTASCLAAKANFEVLK